MIGGHGLRTIALLEGIVCQHDERIPFLETVSRRAELLERPPKVLRRGVVVSGLPIDAAEPV